MKSPLDDLFESYVQNIMFALTLKLLANISSLEFYLILNEKKICHVVFLGKFIWTIDIEIYFRNPTSSKFFHTNDKFYFLQKDFPKPLWSTENNQSFSCEIQIE